MERPSHSISTLLSQSPGRRFGGLSFAVIAQLSFAAVLIGGIVDRIARDAPPPPLIVSKVDEQNSKAPPPPIKTQKPEVPTAALPVIDITAESSGPSITVVPPQPSQPPAQVVKSQPPVPPAAMPDRAATAITQTHTVPPYPTLARRLGAEGKVTLRLSVQADGSVARAEVVTSSGRQDLDQAASQWITAHWTYKPAIRDGVPAASEVLAAVQFNLSTSP